MDDSLNFKTMAGETAKGTSAYTLSPGDSLGQYMIIRPLGKGGMGEVYEAANIVSRKHVALKILSNGATGGTFVDRFRIESRVMSDLRHDNIVQVHHAGSENGHYYLTMDLVLGADDAPQSLEHLLKTDGGKFKPGDVRKYALQILDALEYAHGKDVVHRDLKPGNIMLASDGTLRVTDFGLAKIVGNEYLQSVIERSISLSVAGSVSMGDMETMGSGGDGTKPSSSARALLGTYDYMAPEQKTGGEITARTDIYAFGIILYRLLTGEKPEGRWKRPSAFGVSKRWDRIIDHCMERNPDDRYASVTDLKRDVMSIRSSRGQRWWRSALAALLVAGLGIAAWYGWSQLGGDIFRRDSEVPRPLHVDVAEQARIDELASAVDAALSRGELSQAGEHLKALESAGASADLLTRFESLLEESKTNRRYAEAEQAMEQARRIKGGVQRLDAGLSELETTWREAEAARQSRSWKLALVAYDRVLEHCRSLGELDASRTAAWQCRSEADTARTKAEDENASTDASGLWSQAEYAYLNGTQALESGAFADAGASWKKASDYYDQASEQVLTLERYLKAKGEYEAAVAVDKVLLENHGGDKWRAVLSQAKAGEASGDDPSTGLRAYAAAVSALPAAVSEARVHEGAESASTAAQEARRQAEKARAGGTDGAADKSWAQAENMMQSAKAHFDADRLSDAQHDWQTALREYKVSKTAAINYKNELGRKQAERTAKSAAEQARAKAQNARRAAAIQNAEKDAVSQWRQASASMTLADQDFVAARYSEAHKNWLAAANEFSNAQSVAHDTQHRIEEEKAARQAAETARQQAIGARQRARNANALLDGRNLCDQGDNAMSIADRAFKETRFGDAENAWKKATKHFSDARSTALTVQRERESIRKKPIPVIIPPF